MSALLLRLRDGASATRTLAGNLLFPPQCVLCHAPSDAAGGLCTPCFGDLRPISAPYCACCGHPFPYDLGEGAQCDACLRSPPAYDCARSAWHYDAPAARLIKALKFADRTQLAPMLARVMQGAGAQMLAMPEVQLVPVPLHGARLRQRRYNQAMLLAYALSRRSGVPVLPDALRRLRPTRPQARLAHGQRLRNVEGAFALNPRRADAIAGASLLLIDDVMTTGATLSACAEALRRGGAAWVGVLSVARSLLQHTDEYAKAPIAITPQ